MKALRILMTCLMVVACFNLASCSNDEDDDNKSNSSIVGTWQYKEENEFVITYTFDEDGSFQEINKEFYNGKWDVYTDYGEYKYNSKILTLYYEGEVLAFKVISLTSNTLQLEDEGEIMIFKKM